jgi:molybdenum cofactor guanylyltransferase
MIAGIVLAGGRSKRMGVDKALLPWHGHPLIEHMRNLLLEAGATMVVFSGERVGYAGVADRWPDTGPIGGLASVVAGLDDGELLVVPVDMPLLTVGMLRTLLATTDRPCARMAGAMLPMRMRLDAHSRAVLMEMVGRPGKACSIRALQQALGVAEIEVAADDAARLINCNTPSEWQEVTG